MRSAAIAVLTGLCICLVNLAPALAHPVPFSYLDLRVQPGTQDQIDGLLVAHIFDLAHDLKIDPPERLLEPAIVARRHTDIINLLAPRLTLSADGQPINATWSQIEVLPERQSLLVHVRYRTHSAPGTLTVATEMFPYDATHQTFLNIYEGDALTQAILDRHHRQFEYVADTHQGAPAVVRKFIPAGIHHILVGPDHLLFLVGLLLLGGTIRQLAVVVTAFTVAHSLTLSLAALNIVMPPVQVIEPAIALSIVYVGADNLLVRNGRDVRVWIAFVFGFIHGFGFANVLREMDLPARALGWSLFSFNLGVEIGQLFVVFAVGTALGVVRSRSEVFGRRVAFAGSVVVMAAGTFWFVQRVFFSGGVL